MPVEITFEGDLQPVKQKYDRFVSEVKSKPVVIPVTGAGMAGRSADPVSMLGFGARQNQPTTAGVLGQSGGGDGGGDGSGGGGGRRRGVWQTLSAPLGEEGGSWGRSGAGLGGLIGFGTAANIATRSIGANRQFNIDRVLAGSDQAAQTEAVLKYRQSLISSGGFIGHGLGYLQDPSGMNEAGIRATLSGAAAGDARAGVVGDNARFTAGLRDQTEIAETKNPFQRRLREAEAAHRKERELIEDTAEKQTKADQEVVNERKKILEADAIKRAVGGTRYESEAGTYALYGQAGLDYRKSLIDAASSKDAADVAGTSAELAKKRDAAKQTNLDLAGRRYAAETENDRNAEEFRRIAEGALLSGEGNALRAIAANDPRGARIANLRAQGAAEIAKALSQDDPDAARKGGLAIQRVLTQRAVDRRELDLSGRGLDAAYDVTSRLMNRDPLGARIRGIEAERDAALAKPDADRGRLNRNAAADIDLLKRTDTEDRAFRDRALQDRGTALGLQLKDQQFGGLSATSYSIAADAKNAADLLLAKDPIRNSGAAAQVLKNAQSEELLLKRDFLAAFRPQEIDINRTDLSGGGQGGGDVIKLLGEIAANTAKLDNGPPKAQ
jgi:hypothetical protein